MANTRYTPCSNPNIGISISSLSAESVEYPIVYEGRTYSSIEAFDANNMPAHIFAEKPNFVAAFAGTKIVNGVDTGEPCLVIGVEKKVSLDELSAEDMMPSVLPDGVITDIVEFPKIRAFTTCTDGSGEGCPPHDEKHRPLQGGISAMEETGTACTLGLVVKDSITGNLVALTNNHCAGLLYDTNYNVPTYGSASVAGKNMMQPSPYDGGISADIYGTVVRAVPIKFASSSIKNVVDCSISSIGLDDASTKILEINDGPYAFAIPAEYGPGTQLYKSGRTTGVTPPPAITIYDDDALVSVSYGPYSNDVAYYNHAIIYTSDTRASQGGDSGSAMLAVIGGSYKVVALNFAGNDEGTLGVGCSISDVSTELSVEAWDGDIVVAENSSPSIMVNGVCYERVGDTSDSITHVVDDEFASCLACEDVALESSSSSSSSSESSRTVDSSSVSSSSQSSQSSSSSTEMQSSSISSSSMSSISSSSVSSSSVSSSSSESSSSSTYMKSTSSTSNVSFSSSSSEVKREFTERSPKNLSFDIRGQNQVTLRWYSLRDASGYVVERKEGFADWEMLGDVEANIFVDSGLVPGRYYQYRVRGYING